LLRHCRRQGPGKWGRGEGRGVTKVETERRKQRGRREKGGEGDKKVGERRQQHFEKRKNAVTKERRTRKTGKPREKVLMFQGGPWARQVRRVGPQLST